ncbi:septum formation family protein [Streptomyces sp. TBY4]|uniref:septum formation family protein n=1 Tax=Streptomyces sp. TBY4 TaxID=2962030 RepID=UPI0020B7A7FD|nr:septum formation family protein [Streptomyces sp. TBY4]MCP3755828.1 septum formation family protein [Streptomyces sp. TBY4]
MSTQPPPPSPPPTPPPPPTAKLLVVWGLAVSLVMVLVAALVVPVLGRVADVFEERSGSRRAAQLREDVAGTPVDPSELRLGHCFNVAGGDLLAEAPLVYRVDCTEVHDAEVTSAASVSEPEFPGAEQMRSTAEKDCWTAQHAYAMDTWAVPAYAELYYFAPSRGSWSDGDRRIVCVIGTADREHRGSLRKDAGTLTAEQVAFLRVMNRVDTVLGEVPDGEVEDRLPWYMSWASEMDRALGAESQLLDTAMGRPELAGPAGVQRERLDVARSEWRRAGRAKSAKEFLDAWGRADAALPVEVEKALRGAYGLSARVPEWREGAGGGGSTAPSRRPSRESA